MTTNKPQTVAQYLNALPKDRREALKAVRKVIRDNLDPKLKEGMQYGAIGYYVPHAVYPNGYHCDPRQPLPYAGLASQKNHMAIYLFCLYTSADHQEWFRQAWAKTGKKLDMGKSCLRFKKVDDLALDVLAQAIKRVTAKKFIKEYETGMAHAGRTTRAKVPVAKKPASHKNIAKKTPTKRLITRAK